MNILFLDKEGGYGGSSRSLFLLVKYLNRRNLRPLVISNEAGPIAERYRQINVDHLVHKIPILKPAKRKNSVVLLKFLANLARFARAVGYLTTVVKQNRIDVIHFNHDGYFPYAIVNKIFWRRKTVFHMRTMLPVNIFSRLQAWIIKTCSDHLLFISNNEKERFARLTRSSVPHAVCPNIAENHDVGDIPKPAWLERFGGRFKVLVLTIIAESKGTDRVIDIARELKKNNRAGTVLIVCGSERNRTNRLSLKDQIARRIDEEGLDEYVYLADFQPNPEGIMNHADAVLRLSRENDPWGRDIIEAITNGKPVLATGKNETYVQNGINGYLFEPYDAQAIAEKIFFLSQNRQAHEKIREVNLKKGRELFYGPEIAGQIEAVYRSLNTAVTPEIVSTAEIKTNLWN